LLVEDDETFSAIASGYLESAGLVVEVVSTGHELLRRVATRSYGAVLLDLGLPDEDGLVLLRKLVGRSEVPVMVVSGRCSMEARLAAFEMGAADILTKPLNPQELRYRVLNMLQRRPSAPVPSSIELGPWRIDIACRTVESTATGQGCPLTRAEFDALVFLLRGNGRAYSRAQILDAVTVAGGPDSDRAVDILVSRLRRKLDAEAHAGAAIVTVRGVGYRVERRPAPHASTASASAA